MELNYLAVTILGLGLCVAVVFDFAANRIPNWLVLGMVLAGVVVQMIEAEWAGLVSALFGFFIGLLCFLPLYVFGGLGAGDVKLVGAIGSLVGPTNVIVVALAIILVGGGIALCYITLRGGLVQMARRYHSMMVMLMSRRFQYLPPAPGEAAGMHFPYAIAITCGTALSLLYF